MPATPPQRRGEPIAFSTLVAAIEGLADDELRQPGRHAVLKAWRESADGVEAVTRRVERYHRRNSGNPLGLLVALIKQDEHIPESVHKAAFAEITQPWLSSIHRGDAWDTLSYAQPEDMMLEFCGLMSDPPAGLPRVPKGEVRTYLIDAFFGVAWQFDGSDEDA